MNDIIWGDVTAVLDGDTFDLRTTHLGKSNKYSYNDAERVRLAGVDAPSVSTAAGLIAKRRLQSALLGKHVRCTIHARDVYHRIVCDVQIE